MIDKKLIYSLFSTFFASKGLFTLVPLVTFSSKEAAAVLFSAFTILFLSIIAAFSVFAAQSMGKTTLWIYKTLSQKFSFKSSFLKLHVLNFE